MVSVGAVGSFIAGILSLLSPCSALLLPAFFAYAFQSKRQLLARTGAFFFGLCAVLVPLGTGVGWVGELVAAHRATLISIGGWLLILLGIYTFWGFGFRLPFSSLSNQVRGTSWFSVLLLGAVYGFAGLCAGPLLGAVLTTAAMTSSPTFGAFILLCYALGMTIPLILLAWLWDSRDFAQSPWLRGKSIGSLNTMSMASGALFVLIGTTFLLSHGMSGLPTLVSADQHLQIQRWVLNALDGRELHLVLGALIVALAFAVFRLVRQSKLRS